MLTDLTKISVREISLEDIDLLITYRLAYLEEMQGECSNDYREMLCKELAQYFSSGLKENRLFAFIAEQEQEALSFGAMILKTIPGDLNQTSYIEGDILNMYTVPSARRRGISGLILERLIAEARKRGVSKISLHTSADGEKLYRKFGFSEPVFPVLELGLQII